MVVLRRVISTLRRPASSFALPAKVSGPPGETTSVGAGVGGVIAAGELMVTVGATPVEEMIQSRVALRRSACPAVSMAVALPRHSPSCGSVTSKRQVAEVAPMTSGSPLKVLKTGATVPSSCSAGSGGSRRGTSTSAS